MTQPWVDDAKYITSSTASSSSHPVHLQFSSQPRLKCSPGNVFQLLSWREVSPRAKHTSKRLWGETSRLKSARTEIKCETTDARHALVSWVEAESLRHLSANYCPLLPPPRSTIAAAFSSDGKALASTHGDHTVKIIDCQTGKCLKVLSGHRRTPWVVRFHPLHSEVLASGSLDHEVRLWDARTADCIGSRDFSRPIASIAFHAQGELLAVASGHKLYIWNYNSRGESSSPTIVLRTRRSLRAVHFHPHAASLLLTAEVNDLDCPDTRLTLATTSGYLQHPPPAVFFANPNSSYRPHLESREPLIPSYLFRPTLVRDEGRTTLHQGGRTSSSSNVQKRETSPSTQQHMYADSSKQTDNLVTPMEMSPGEPCGSNLLPEDAITNHLLGSETAIFDSAIEAGGSTGRQPSRNFQERSFNTADRSPTFQHYDITTQMPIPQSRPTTGDTSIHVSNTFRSTDPQMLLRSVEGGQVHQFIPFTDPACWELPFLQGWLMGQTHASLHTFLPVNGAVQGNPSFRGAGPELLASELLYHRNIEALVAPPALTATISHPRASRGSGSRHRSRSRMISSTGLGEGALFLNTQNEEAAPRPIPTGIESEISTSLAAAAAAELPCTVKLRIWSHNIQEPCASLDPGSCKLTIPHAVLCSEMGAHFSPCGRFLVACVACMLPSIEGEPGVQSQFHHDVSGAATSPTRHPISAHQVMYELRVYSLEEENFGEVLASRAIRAAHCLTSIQFSPTSEHILLAYGRRHSSLLRSIVVDGESGIPIYTILEVYRVSDMDLVRVLPSAEDEVNVACFHPQVGGGLVYGTKEGKLRILQYEGSDETDCLHPNFSLEENILENKEKNWGCRLLTTFFHQWSLPAAGPKVCLGRLEVMIVPMYKFSSCRTPVRA